MTKKQKHLLVRIIVAAVLFAAGGLLHLEGWAELGVYLVCYAVIGWDIVLCRFQVPPLHHQPDGYSPGLRKH